MTTQTFRPVVAGVDGSPGSLAAVEWAAREAERRHLGLRLVHGYVQPVPYATFGYPAHDIEVEVPLRQVRAMLADAAAGVRRRHPDLWVESALIGGSPAGVLVRESRLGTLVVVGARGQGGFTGLLAGSVSTQLAAHAHSPVVVVRPPDDEHAATRPVVVGVDGSAESTAALGFAFDAASARGVGLVAIYAWQALPTTNLGPVTRCHYDPAQARAEAARMLAEQLAGWQEKYPDVPVERRAILSFNPAETLVEASADAGLVVVGSRGLGGFTGMLLGSASRALVHHAHCTLAVVHGPEGNVRR
jgi:nucleotide-binding universal stress UspA family protein